jgi:SAM-dependent methyltransferase
MRIAGRKIQQMAERFLRGKLLDIGCGEKWKQDLIGHTVEEYIGLDHPQTAHDSGAVDRFGTAYDIPAQDGEFDSVICTSVLEHLEEPAQALRECRRVLKTGGFALLTMPQSWHLHEEPRDFYRYTKYGLKYLFEQNGFAIEVLEPLAGFWVTNLSAHCYYWNRFRRRRRLHPLRWLAPVFIAGLQVLGLALNKFDRSFEFTWAYIAVIKKELDM